MEQFKKNTPVMLHLLKIFFYTLLLVYVELLGSTLGFASDFSGKGKVTAGDGHTCVITAAGGVKCWGYNEFGQLGDNSTINRLTPVDVVGLASGVMAVTTGLDSTCALTITGEVKCWGNNMNGQLGDNSTTKRSAPVSVLGLNGGVVAIATGFYHTCAITTGGKIKCWGHHSDDYLNPKDETSLASGVTAIAAGEFNICALTTAGGVKCWGGNSTGKLGDTHITVHSSWPPVDVLGLNSGVAAITLGYRHACALTITGGVKCWGNNDKGQLGDNSTTNSLAPVNVDGLNSGVVAIAAGYFHTCAITTAGGIKCWGQNNEGQLGDNSTTDRLTPVDVSGLNNGVATIAAGYLHTCAITTAGGVKCWGGNVVGQLGDNSSNQHSTPVDVAGLVGWMTAKPVVIEFFNTILDNYFVTADTNEATQIDGGSAGPGWIRTGETFKSGGSTPVCRFYGSYLPGPNSHFYTADSAECQGLKDQQIPTGNPSKLTVKSWNFESLDFITTPPINGQCSVGTVPVYRAYNNGFSRGIDSNHRISTNQAAIAQVVARGWANEGVVMCAPL